VIIRGMMGGWSDGVISNFVTPNHSDTHNAAGLITTCGLYGHTYSTLTYHLKAEWRLFLREHDAHTA